MASAGDTYQIELKTLHEGVQLAHTRWYWQVVDDEALITAAAVGGYVEAFLGLDWSPVLHQSNDFVQLRVINGSDNSDFVDYNPFIPGTKTGPNIPAALCFYVRSFNRGPGYTRSDYFLMAGGLNDIISPGVWSPGFRSACGFFETMFGSSIPREGTSMIPVQLAAPFKLGVVPTIKQSLVGEWEHDVNPHWLRTRQDEAYAPLIP